MGMAETKLGTLLWNQYTDWSGLLEAGRTADRLGYDSLWTWDHLYPIVGSARGPILEGWLTITAWAMATTRVTVGLMVGANTFREPALVDEGVGDRQARLEVCAAIARPARERDQPGAHRARD